MPPTKLDRIVLEAVTSFLDERRHSAVHIDSYLRGQWQVISRQHSDLADRREEFMRRAAHSIKAALIASDKIRDLREAQPEGGVA